METETTKAPQVWEIRLAFGLALLTSLCRTFRMPNPWSTAHWLVNYQFGVVKRGLAGSIVSPIIEGKGHAAIQTIINLVSSALTGLWVVTVIWITTDTLRKCRNPLPTALGILAILIGPYALMTGHINGYYDVILFMLAALACLCVKRGNSFLAGCLLAIGILCHETILLFGAPAVAFAIVAKHHKEGEWGCWRPLIWCGVPMGIALGGLMLAREHQNSALLLQQLIGHMKQQGFEHGHYLMVPHAITAPFGTPWEIMFPQILKTLTLPPYPVQTGIPVMAIAAICACQFPKGRVRTGLTALAAVTMLAPLAIHTLAWDTSRIWTYPLGNGLLVLWGACQFGTEKDPKENRWVNALAWLAVATAIASETPLMDSLRARGTWQTALMGYIPALALILWGTSVNPNPPNATPKADPASKASAE